MKTLFLVSFLSLFSVNAYAENATNCYVSSFGYIFSEFNTESNGVRKLPKEKIDKITSLRKKALELANEANRLNLTEEEKLNADTPNGLKLASLNAEITAICVSIELLAN